MVVKGTSSRAGLFSTACSSTVVSFIAASLDDCKRSPDEGFDSGRPCEPRGGGARAFPEALRQGPIDGQPVEGFRDALRGGRRDEAIDLVLHELRGTPAVGSRDHGLARPERFEGDEPVVLVPGRKVDGAAARVVVDQLTVRDGAEQLDAVAQPEGADPLLETRTFLAFAGDADAQRAILHE